MTTTKECPPNQTLKTLALTINSVGRFVDGLAANYPNIDTSVIKASVEALESIAVTLSKERKALLAKLNEVICELETFRDDRTWDDQETRLLMEFSRFHHDAERGIIELPAQKPEEKVKVA